MADFTPRFLEFLRALPDAESIDDLGLPEIDGVRRADYLLGRRRAIIEVKSLEEDPAERVETITAPLRERDDFPLFYGEMDIQKVLKHLPDGEAINRKLFLNLTRTVERAVREAEKQVDHTRATLGIPGALGGLVVVNGEVEFFSPEIVGHRIHSTMNRPRTEADRAPPLDFVWVVFGRHVYELGKFEAMPTIWHIGPRARVRPRFARLADQLSRRWARFNGALHIEAAMSQVGPSKYQGAETEVAPEYITRQQAWEREYAQNPHLRALTLEAFLEHGSDVVGRFGRSILKGAPPMQPDARLALLRELAHFMVEAQHRGVDLKDMPKPDFGLPVRKLDE